MVSFLLDGLDLDSTGGWTSGPPHTDDGTRKTPPCCLKVGQRQICPLCAHLNTSLLNRLRTSFGPWFKAGPGFSKFSAPNLVYLMFSEGAHPQQVSKIRNQDTGAGFVKLLRSFVFISLITSSMILHVTIVTPRRC